MRASPKIVTLPTLVEILVDPTCISNLPKELIPQLRGELAKLDSILLSRMLTVTAQAPADDDQLLDVAQASAKLGTTEDWVYRHAKSLPFTIRVGKKCLRFSKAGMDRYIRQRAG